MENYAPASSSPPAPPEIEIGERTYRVVLVDLDGTLLAADGQPSARTKAAIAAIAHRGVQVMVATGRSVSSACHALEALRLELPVVCYNGGTFHCQRTGRLLRNLVLQAGIARQVMAELVSWRLDFFASRNDEKFTLAGHDPEYRRMLENLEHVTRVATPEEIPTEGLSRISILGPIDRVLAVQEKFHADHHPNIYLEDFALSALPNHRSSSLYVSDAHPPSRGKAEALHYLEEQCGIPREDVVAIGDGCNDLTMLRAAGLSVAMGNAHPDVLAAATRVIGHHDEDAVALLLEELFLS